MTALPAAAAPQPLRLLAGLALTDAAADAAATDPQTAGRESREL